jgi:hypothetical protein
MIYIRKSVKERVGNSKNYSPKKLASSPQIQPKSFVFQWFSKPYP